MEQETIDQDHTIIYQDIDEDYLNNNKSKFTSNVTFIGCAFEVGAETLTDFDCTGLFLYDCTFFEPKVRLVNFHNLQTFQLNGGNIIELILDETPNLQSLRVDKCPYINSIDSNTKLLQDIFVVGCDWLKKIVFPNNHLFKKIIEIKIVGCPQITEIQLKIRIKRINKLFKSKKLDDESKTAIETFNGIVNQSTTSTSKRVTRRNSKGVTRRKSRRSMTPKVGSNNS
jgi:hypothetical protein